MATFREIREEAFEEGFENGYREAYPEAKTIPYPYFDAEARPPWYRSLLWQGMERFNQECVHYASALYNEAFDAGFENGEADRAKHYKKQIEEKLHLYLELNQHYEYLKLEEERTIQTLRDCQRDLGDLLEDYGAEELEINGHRIIFDHEIHVNTIPTKRNQLWEELQKRAIPYLKPDYLGVTKRIKKYMLEHDGNVPEWAEGYVTVETYSSSKVTPITERTPISK